MSTKYFDIVYAGGTKISFYDDQVEYLELESIEPHSIQELQDGSSIIYLTDAEFRLINFTLKAHSETIISNYETLLDVEDNITVVIFNNDGTVNEQIKSKIIPKGQLNFIIGSHDAEKRITLQFVEVFPYQFGAVFIPQLNYITG